MTQAEIDQNIFGRATGSTVTPERAAQIAIENQAGSTQARPGGLQAASSWTTLSGSDALLPSQLQVTRLEFGLFNGSDGQIDDCHKDKCMVKGKPYADSTDIPGNHPKPLLHPDGTPVIGPDGKPIVGPDRVDLEAITKDIAAHRNMLTVPTAIWNFRHAGAWDFQRTMNDDGRPIFTQQYQNFANVAIGYILGSLGMSLDEMARYANAYCSVRCGYDEPMSKQYPSLADRQVKDFEIGLKLYKERHPDSKK
jgi:hypothetical protein